MFISDNIFPFDCLKKRKAFAQNNCAKQLRKHQKAIAYVTFAKGKLQA